MNLVSWYPISLETTFLSCAHKTQYNIHLSKLVLAANFSRDQRQKNYVSQD